MDYYAFDATCTCVDCITVFDVWNIGKTIAEITPDTSYLYLVKGQKELRVQ